MKTFEYYDITCALTHNIDTCERCKKCGDDCTKIRLDMVEYVKALHKAIDKACEELAKRGRNCVSCNFEDCSNFELNPLCEDKKFWKEYLLKESEKQ